MSSTNNHHLVVPKKTYSSSISSMNSVIPQFITNHRHSKSSSNMRLSRTNTNTESVVAPSINEYGSKKAIDNLPTARSSMSYLDKLWTQIDVLDDVRNMSEQVKQKGSFFNEKFNEELAKLKSLQDKLMQAMEANLQTRHIKGHRGSVIPESQKSVIVESQSIEDQDIDHEEERNITEFFENDHQNREQFIHGIQETKLYINAVRENLDEVAESMKKFDETTRENW